MVERPGPDLRRLRADQRLEPADHLAGRAAGEGDQQDRLGRDPPGDQVGDAVGDHPRLARARPGQDQVVPVRGRGRRALRRRSGRAANCSREPVVGRLLEPDLPHADGRRPVVGSGFSDVADLRIIATDRRESASSSGHRPGSASTPSQRGSRMSTMEDRTRPPRSSATPGSTSSAARRSTTAALAALPGRPRRRALVDRHRGGRREAGRGRRPALLHVASPSPGPAATRPTSATSSRSATARCWSTRSSTSSSPGVSRSFTHELVRHRAGFGYSQLSQRFVDESECAFVEPDAIADDPELHRIWLEAVAAVPAGLPRAGRRPGARSSRTSRTGPSAARRPARRRGASCRTRPRRRSS